VPKRNDGDIVAQTRETYNRALVVDEDLTKLTTNAQFGTA